MKPGDREISRTEAARLCGVSVSAVNQAAFVRRYAAPEVVAKVRAGSMSLERAVELAAERRAKGRKRPMTSATLNRFDQIMHKDAWGGADPPARTALRDVADTMYACREWFEGYKVPYTGADVVAMASLALKRERELSDAVKREAWERANCIGDQQDA